VASVTIPIDLIQEVNFRTSGLMRLLFLAEEVLTISHRADAPNQVTFTFRGDGREIAATLNDLGIRVGSTG